MKVWTALNDVLREYYESCAVLADSSRGGRSSAAFSAVLERATRDRQFRTKLLEFPVETLHNEGFDLPKGFMIRFVEDTEHTTHLPIPPFVGELPEKTS